LGKPLRKKTRRQAFPHGSSSACQTAAVETRQFLPTWHGKLLTPASHKINSLLACVWAMWLVFFSPIPR